MSNDRLRGMAVLATGLVGAVAAMTAGVAPPAGATSPVTVDANLCYRSSHGTCVDGTSQEFDACLPSGATRKTPGVILVHGGGFIGGDEAMAAGIDTKLAGDGFAAFPTESRDVMAVTSYLRAHARTFDVDPDRLGSFGLSAGATLAVYSVSKANRCEPSAHVLADAGWSDAYDCTVGSSGAVDPRQLQHAEYYLGCTDPTDPASAATATAASAVSLVQPGDPATLLAISTDHQVGSEIVDPALAQEMAAHLTAAVGTVQLDLDAACAHATGYVNIELAATVAFLEAHLFVAPVVTPHASHTFREGTAGTFTVKSTADPTAVLTESGPLPTGITFVDQGTGDAVLAGTPAAGTADSCPITVREANGGGPVAVQQFTLVVSAPRR